MRAGLSESVSVSKAQVRFMDISKKVGNLTIKAPTGVGAAKKNEDFV